MSEIAPGWYKDPADPTTQRYWDGEVWIGDPLPADATPPDGPPAGAASVPVREPEKPRVDAASGAPSGPSGGTPSATPGARLIGRANRRPTGRRRRPFAELDAADRMADAAKLGPGRPPPNWMPPGPGQPGAGHPGRSARCRSVERRSTGHRPTGDGTPRRRPTRRRTPIGVATGWAADELAAAGSPAASVAARHAASARRTAPTERTDREPTAWMAGRCRLPVRRGGAPTARHGAGPARTAARRASHRYRRGSPPVRDPHRIPGLPMVAGDIRLLAPDVADHGCRVQGCVGAECHADHDQPRQLAVGGNPVAGDRHMARLRGAEHRVERTDTGQAADGHPRRRPGRDDSHRRTPGDPPMDAAGPADARVDLRSARRPLRRCTAAHQLPVADDQPPATPCAARSTRVHRGRPDRHRIRRRPSRVGIDGAHDGGWTARRRWT